jgi:hypothetical protein
MFLSHVLRDLFLDDRLSGKIFEYLITTALESPNEELKQEAVAGIAKVSENISVF